MVTNDVYAVPPGRPAHHRSHEIVSRHSQQDFFFHHFLTPGVPVMNTYRSLQGAQVGVDVPALAIQPHDLVDRQWLRGEQIEPLFRLAPSRPSRDPPPLRHMQNFGGNRLDAEAETG